MVVRSSTSLMTTRTAGRLRGPSAARTSGGTSTNAPASSRSVHQRCRRSEEHTSELQSRGHLVCRLLLEKKKIPSGSKQPCPTHESATRGRSKTGVTSHGTRLRQGMPAYYVYILATLSRVRCTGVTNDIM